jgi:hypothetical protein
MSNVVAFNPSKVPSFVQKAELSSLAKALVGSGTDNTKRVSIKGGVFRLVAGNKEIASIEDRHLDVVIVNAAPKVARTFYAGKFVEGENNGPACWSPDGETPSKDATDPQSDRCATCPQNVRGSGEGESRACRYSQRLAVVLADDLEGDVLQLTLPATSIFGKEEGENRPLQAYARWLAAQNINPEMVVTHMKFDTKAAVPKLFFKPMRWLDDEEYETVVSAGKSDTAVKAITLSFAQVDKAAASTQDEPPAPAPKKSKAKKEESAEDHEEPTVRKDSSENESVPKRGNLANVVANWDVDDE